MKADAQQQHTPTPWEAYLNEDGAFVRRVPEEKVLAGGIRQIKHRRVARFFGAAVADGEALANAQFVVRAVNAHADLLAAAMHGAIAVEHVIDDIETFASPDAEARKDIPEWRKVLAEIQSAISRAEGRAPVSQNEVTL